jgi:hypothetical protein
MTCCYTQLPFRLALWLLENRERDGRGGAERERRNDMSPANSCIRLLIQSRQDTGSEGGGERNRNKAWMTRVPLVHHNGMICNIYLPAICDRQKHATDKVTDKTHYCHCGPDSLSWALPYIPQNGLTYNQ